MDLFPFESDGLEGFMPPADAAREMGLSLEELQPLIGVELEARHLGPDIYVRPAIVSKGAVGAWATKP